MQKGFYGFLLLLIRSIFFFASNRLFSSYGGINLNVNRLFLIIYTSLFQTFTSILRMFLSYSLLSRIRFRLLLIRFFFTCLVISRGSPVPGHTFHTYRSPYSVGFSLVLFQFLPNFQGLRPIEQGSTSSFLLLLREVLFTIRQDSLYVAVYMIVSTSYKATLPIRLVPCITTTHRI